MLFTPHTGRLAARHHPSDRIPRRVRPIVWSQPALPTVCEAVRRASLLMWPVRAPMLGYAAMALLSTATVVAATLVAPRLLRLVSHTSTLVYNLQYNTPWASTP